MPTLFSCNRHCRLSIARLVPRHRPSLLRLLLMQLSLPTPRPLSPPSLSGSRRPRPSTASISPLCLQKRSKPRLKKSPPPPFVPLPNYLLGPWRLSQAGRLPPTSPLTPVRLSAFVRGSGWGKLLASLDCSSTRKPSPPIAPTVTSVAISSTSSSPVLSFFLSAKFAPM